MSDQPITDQYLDEIEVRAKAAAKTLRELLPPKQDYAELVCAEGFARGFHCVWTEPEPYAMEDAANVIDKLAAEVRRLRVTLQGTDPVRHGRWHRVPNDYGYLYAGQCSNCGCEPLRGFGRLQWDYCHHCGAKMDATRAEATDADGRGN